MCNNCRNYVDIYYDDFTENAKLICELVEEVVNCDGKQITLNYLLKILTPGAPKFNEGGVNDLGKLDSVCPKDFRLKSKTPNFKLKPLNSSGYKKVCDKIKLSNYLETKVSRSLAQYSTTTIRRLLIKMLELEILKEKLEKFGS